MTEQIKLIECPRDAMQGLEQLIPTEQKVKYLNTLLKVGFHTLDFGSFVSSKAVPQLKDTGEVVENLDLTSTSTELLAIIGNERGANEAIRYPQIKYLGFPFSISPTFLRKNINSTPKEAFQRLQNIQNICVENRKNLVAYISMAFGNPYEDEWNLEIIHQWAEKLNAAGISIISLADTVGMATPDTIGEVYSFCRHQFPAIEWGLHLHTTTYQWKEKLDAAYESGCRRFDAVHNGLGGCPMAGHELVGNVNTRDLVAFLKEKNTIINLDFEQLREAETIAVDF